MGEEQLAGQPTNEEKTGIDKKVTLWIEGKHGRIGIIAPKEKPTDEEFIELHRKIAEIALQSAKKNEAAK